MDLHVWLAFVAASAALLLIPGPTVLLVLSYALSQGRRVALATVAGVALGDLLADYIRNTSRRQYKAWASRGVMEDALALFTQDN